jgi:hypothetical protein
MNFERAPEFARELGRLKKKWRSLENDLKVAEKVIESLYVQPVSEAMPHRPSSMSSRGSPSKIA